jgi:CRP/FNR family transcriptional regulator, polysaccharide utilization system transcription regulator
MKKTTPQQSPCEHCNSMHQSIFCNLKPKELDDLGQHKTINIYKKNQVIFHEGNRPLGLYCIKKGKVKIFKTGIDGREQIVRLAKNGNLIGYRSFLGEEFYSASASAIEDTELCFIDKNDFFGVLKNNDKLSWKLIQMLTTELRDAENLVRDMAQKSVRERLAEVLLILKEKFGPDKDDPDVLNCKMSREELASFVGTATETLIRLLSDFKQEKLIETKGKNIRLLDVSALAEVANLDY